MDFEIKESENLYPSIEEVEGVALAALDAEEDQIEADEEKEEEQVEGIGDLGKRKSYRRKFRSRRRTKRRKTRSRSTRKAYSSGTKSSTIKVGLTKGLTSRGAFELRKAALPKETQKALAEGKMQPVDAAIYAIKSIAGVNTIELFQASDDKKAGKTNINRAQLDSGKYFLMTEIVLEYAKGADAADNNPATFAFGQSALPAEILNGTFEMVQGTRVVLPEVSCGIFDDTDTTQRSFSYKLANPKFLVPGQDIKPELKMVTTMDEAVTNPAVKITILGTWTEKA